MFFLKEIAFAENWFNKPSSKPQQRSTYRIAQTIFGFEKM